MPIRFSSTFARASRSLRQLAITGCYCYWTWTRITRPAGKDTIFCSIAHGLTPAHAPWRRTSAGGAGSRSATRDSNGLARNCKSPSRASSWALARSRENFHSISNGPTTCPLPATFLISCRRGTWRPMGDLIIGTLRSEHPSRHAQPLSQRVLNVAGQHPIDRIGLMPRELRQPDDRPVACLLY